MDEGVIYSQCILLLTFLALGYSQTVPPARAQPSNVPPAPADIPPAAAKQEPAKLPLPEKRVESALERQRNSILRQVEAVKRINPEAFPITKLPGEEPQVVAPLPPPFDPAKQISCIPLPRGGLEPVITLAASRAGVSSDLIRAVIVQESAFNPCAISPKGALGLMQLMPETARQFGVSDPFDPGQNIGAGANLLRQLLDRYGGDLSLALSAYNAGPTTVDKTGKMPAIPETVNYVRRIMGSLGIQ